MSEYQKAYIQDLIERLAFPMIVFIFTVVFYFSSRGLREESVMYPHIIMWLIGIFLVINISITVWQWSRKVKAKADPEANPIWVDKFTKGLVTFLATIAYILIMPRVGFSVTTLAYMLGVTYYLGARRWHTIVVVGVIFVLLYGAFILWLRVPLPQGVLF